MWLNERVGRKAAPTSKITRRVGGAAINALARVTKHHYLADVGNRDEGKSRRGGDNRQARN